MSSIVTAVFRATIGFLVTKGRDTAAEKLKNGDVTDEKFRGLIVRELDDVKSKLEGLSRKDLLASISFFEEGIELLYEVFDKARTRSEQDATTTEAACEEAFSLTEGIRKLEVTDLDEATVRKLCNSKDRFKQARIEATRAFKNEALKTSDRILAMQYRVMATVLETVDNPEDAIAPCRVCLKELNSLSAVQNSFDVQLKKGIQTVRGMFGKEERRKIISNVCLVNRVIYDVTQTVGKYVSLWSWPTVDIREDTVDPLRDERVTGVLRKEGIEHCYVPWSFGQEGEEKHKLKDPHGIATDSRGQFIVADRGDMNLKVFDSSGKFITLFSLPTNKVTTVDIRSVYVETTDLNDTLYVLVPHVYFDHIHRDNHFMYILSDTGDLQRKFPLTGLFPTAMTVTDSDKVLVLQCGEEVDVYDTDGQLVRSFGAGILKSASDITAANDGRVMVVDNSCVHIFSEDGVHLSQIKLQRHYFRSRILFHRASEHVIVAGNEGDPEGHLFVEIRSKDGEFERITKIHGEKGNTLKDMTVSTNGRIAMLLLIQNLNLTECGKVLVL